MPAGARHPEMDAQGASRGRRRHAWVVAAFEEGREISPAHEDAIRTALEAVGIGFPFEIANGRALRRASPTRLAIERRGISAASVQGGIQRSAMPIHQRQKIDGLGVRGVLHGHDALLHRLKSRSEHGCCQLDYALAIADSGFDPFLDQPLLQFNIFRRAFHPDQRLHRGSQVPDVLCRQFLIRFESTLERPLASRYPLSVSASALPLISSFGASPLLAIASVVLSWTICSSVLFGRGPLEVLASNGSGLILHSRGSRNCDRLGNSHARTRCRPGAGDLRPQARLDGFFSSGGRIA